MMFDFVTFGSSTQDVFVETDQQQEVLKISHPSFDESLIAYPLGGKILIKDIMYETGGGGTNAAVALSLLGNSVGFFGNIGNDPASDLILAMLKKYGISFVGKRINGKSGYSVILDSFKDDRTILTYKGINNESLPNFGVQTRAIYSSSLVGNAFNSQIKIFASIKKHDPHIKIFYNPSSYIASLGFSKLKSLFDSVDVLIFNLEEARMLLKSSEAPFDLLKRLDPYFEVAIITNGSDGAYLVRDGVFYHIFSNKVKVVETTGAGDAFGSTFSSLYFKTRNIEYALKGAVVNSESAIQKKGAKKGLLSYDSLHRKIVSGKFKIEKRI